MYGNTDSPELRKVFGAAETEKEPESLRLPFHIHIIGPKQSGKSHFAKLLAAHLPSVCIAETSAFLMEEAGYLLSGIFPELYSSLDEARALFLQKSGVDRASLAALGNFMTALNPDCLIKGALSGTSILSGAIVVGVRRKIELEAWFGNAYRGWDHCRDVLIEIVDSTSDDTHYELRGWHDRQRDAVKFPVDAQSREAGWVSYAEHIAAEIRAMI
jgi:hypothetical protein